MKTRNQLITSAYVLVMVIVLLLSSTAVMAGSGFEASAPGSPTGPEPVVTINYPTTGSFNNTGSVTAKWTVQPNRTIEFASIWNHTKITKAGAPDGPWINTTIWGNHTFTGLTDGMYIITVKAVYWNSSAGVYQNGTKTTSFTVDQANPTLMISSPSNGLMTNKTNFTAAWTVDGTGTPVTMVRGFMKNVTDNFVYPWVTVTGKSSQWITNFTAKAPLIAGQWNLTMEATDSAGNVGLAWSNFTVSPYVTITFPGEFTDLTNFTFAWTPSLIDGTTLVGYDVSLWNNTDGTWLGATQTVTVPEIWLHNLTGGQDLVNGKSYIVYVNVTDSNADFNNVSKTFGVDVSAPIVSWITPQNDTLVNNNNLAIQWSADSGFAPIVRSNLNMTNSTGHSEFLDIFSDVNTTTIGAIWGSAVPDGSYVLTVVAYDDAGNFAQAMTNFTLDATAPSFDIASPVPGSYTNLNNFTASWSVVETGSGFVSAWGRLVNVSGVFNYTWMAIPGTGSQWITNFSNHQVLEEGTWALQLSAIDVAGNNGTTVSIFTVDQTAPTATIDVPGEFINMNNFTASWTASGTGSPVSHYRVRVEAPNGSSAGFSANITQSSAWITNFTTGHAVLYEGVWTMDLFVEDMAGNSATITKVFTVDLTKPLVIILFPSVDGEGIATMDVNVTWDGSDALSGIDHYNVSMDGVWTVLGDVKNNVFVNLSEGSHTVVVVAFDMAGNTQSATRTFIVDVTKPSVAITFPAMDQIFNVDTVNATWTMSDTNLDHADVSLDGAEYVSVGLNNWSLLSDLTDGSHTFSVIAYDIAGNWNESNVTFFVDKVSPVVAILNPVDGAYYNVTNIIAAWLGVDPTPSSGISFYESQIDSEGWVYMGATTVRQLNLTEGVHLFQVRAFDNASNNFTTSVSFVVDLTMPEVSILSPSEGAMLATADVYMNWTATDNFGIASYEIMIDDGAWMPLEMATNYTFTGLVDGAHVAYVKAVDLAGNYNVTSVSFVTDVTPPDVVIVVPADGSMFAVDSVFVEWTVMDNTTGVSYVWAWVDDDAPVNVTELTNTTFTGLAEGNHVIYVQAWDMVGNSQAKSVSVLVDLSAPTIDITSPANLAHLNSRTVTIDVTVTDAFSGVQSVQGKLGSSEVWTDIVDGTYTFTVPSDTTTTPYTFMVRATDNVGNVGESQVQFFVDTVAPSIAGHVPATGANGVLRAAVVTVDFDEEMLPDSVTVTLSPAVSGTYLWNSAHTQVIFTPGSSLSYATVYSVSVEGTDLAGNALTGTKTWTFVTIALVTGVVLDVNGNPIANATVNMSQGTGFWSTTTTDANGNFGIEVPVGTYNITISASGQKDLVRNDVVVGSGESNVIPDLGMSPVDDWTWLIVALVIIVAALLVLLYLWNRSKQGKKPEEPKEEPKP